LVEGVTEDDLRTFFNSCGTITDVFIKTGSKGLFAFVEFSTLDEAEDGKRYSSYNLESQDPIFKGKLSRFRMLSLEPQEMEARMATKIVLEVASIAEKKVICQENALNLAKEDLKEIIKEKTKERIASIEKWWINDKSKAHSRILSLAASSLLEELTTSTLD
jgi:hypothetical protein